MNLNGVVALEQARLAVVCRNLDREIAALAEHIGSEGAKRPAS